MLTEKNLNIGKLSNQLSWLGCYRKIQVSSCKTFLFSTLLFLAGLIFNSQLFSAIGCMSYPHSIDKSEHAEYQYVKCSCPCQRTSSEAGKCSDCWHFGDPNRGFNSANQDLR